MKFPNRPAWNLYNPNASVTGRNQLIAQRIQRKTMETNYDFSEGRRGAVIPQKGKTRISIFIDNVVLDGFRARAEKAGTGYQAMMNEALRKHLGETEQPVTAELLRQVLRQEMTAYLKEAAAQTPRKRST